MLRNHHHRALDAAICVGHVRDVRSVVNDGCVVDVRYLGDIHGRITDIDAIHIGFTHVIRRDINFPRTERKPSYVAAEAAWAPANEHHQSRGVDGVHGYRTRDPPPTSADADPTAVVERSVAPGRVVDPSPSPGRDPIPVSFVIRSPAFIDVVGEPDVSVVGVVAPVAVVVKIVVTNYIGREVMRGAGIIVAMIAGFRPTVKLICVADLLYVGVQRIGAAERAGLSGVQCVGLTVACSLALAFPDGDDGVAAIFAGIESVVSGLRDGECQVWRVDFEVVIVLQVAHGDAN